MGGLLNIIIQPLGWIMLTLYNLVNNYGFSIILFTIIVKALILPLSVKQQKAMVETQKIQPLLQELQAKYKNDKEKLNQETMNLYKEYNVNPMASCLPLLIQLPIMLALFRVISDPLTTMFRLTQETVLKLANALGLAEGASQITISHALNSHPEIIEQLGLTDIVKTINFNFLGLDLSSSPQLNSPSWLWLIPVLAAVTTFLSSKMMQAKNSQNSSAQSSEASSAMNSMNYMMPVMTLIFTFNFPSGVGLYWLVSNLVQVAQQYFLNIWFKRKDQKDVIDVKEVKPKKENLGSKGKKK